MIIIPIGHENDTVRRLPWITFSILAICLVLHIFISIEVKKLTPQVEIAAKELVNYYFNYPYLVLDPERKKLLFAGVDSEEFEKMLSIRRQNMSRPNSLRLKERQEKLNQLSQKFTNTLNGLPYRTWGFIPAKKSLIALLTYMFVHGGWLHLLGNLLFLYLTGPFIEDLWGRPLYISFYLLMGVLSALMYAQHYPHLTGPLIGASGAIAGVMGAFLIKYWRIKINFFYFIFPIFRGTFKAPAWLMLPLWLFLEIFNAKVVDSINLEGGGVAHWAHVWGFVLGMAVAIGMKTFKVEEKYIHQKIEAKVQGDEVFDAVINAIRMKNLGMINDAYALLLDEARKNPARKDVVETLWEFGSEIGYTEELTRFFMGLIEKEIRNDQIDVAFNHFMDLKEKIPQASINPTYKFMLVKYLAEHKDIEGAKELALELLEEIDLNSSPRVLQNFAILAKELSPSITKKVIELCLQHTEIPGEKKDLLKQELLELNLVTG
jgi:membrane associated rhomboid family serine protease